VLTLLLRVPARRGREGGEKGRGKRQRGRGRKERKEGGREREEEGGREDEVLTGSYVVFHLPRQARVAAHFAVCAEDTAPTNIGGQRSRPPFVSLSAE